MEELPYVGLEHIESGDVKISRHGLATDVRSAKTLFDEGDLLYGKLRPYLDKVALAERSGMCSTDIVVFSIRDGFDPTFMAFRLHSWDFRQYATDTMTGTNHPRTSWPKLKDFSFFCPSLEEQRSIATVLGTLHRAIGQAEQVITAGYSLKGALLQNLVASPIDRWAASDSTTESLEDVATIRTSTSPLSKVNAAASKAGGRRVLYLKVSDLSNAGADGYVRQAATEVPVHESELAGLKLVPAGAVVFPKRGAAISTNRKARTAEYSMLDPNVIAVIPVEIEATYLYRWFETFDLRSLVEAAVLPQINKKDIAPLKVRVPPRNVQLEVGTVLDKCEDKIQAEADSLAALREVYQSLLQELMRGDRRVTYPAVPNAESA